MKRIIVSFVALFLFTVIIEGYSFEFSNSIGPLNSWVVNSTIDSISEKGKPETNFTAEPGWRIYIDSMTDKDIIFEAIRFKGSGEKGSLTKSKKGPLTYTMYKMNKTANIEKLTFISGFVASFLVVPYKYRTGLKDDKLDPAWHPSSSIGFALGFRRAFFTTDIYISPVGFAGLGLIPKSDINSEKVKMDNGFSAGFGLIWDFPKLKDIQVGVVMGWDYISDWEYNRDPWISAAVGFKFVTF